MTKYLFPIILMVISTACAINMPLSEGIIYHDQDEEPYLVRHTRGLPAGELGGDITMLMLPSAALSSAREQIRSDGETNDIIFSQLYFAGLPNPGASYPVARKAAIGIRPFPFIMPTIDGTVHLAADVWASGTFQYIFIGKPEFELILQRPFYRIHNGGLSIGGFYRDERLTYFTEDEPFSISNLIPSTIRTQWFGVRLSGQMERDQYNRSRFFFNAGYNPDYGSTMFAVGVSFTSRPKSAVTRQEPYRW